MTPRCSRSVLPVGVSAPPAEGGREPESSWAAGEAGVPALGERASGPVVAWESTGWGWVSIPAAGSDRSRWGGGAASVPVAAVAGRPVSAAPGRCCSVAARPREGVPLVQVGNDHVHPEGQAVNGPDHVAQARFLGLFRAGALRLFAHLHRGAFPDVLRGDSRLEGTGCAGGGIGKTPGRPAAGSWAAAVPVALRRIPPPGWQR